MGALIISLNITQHDSYGGFRLKLHVGILIEKVKKFIIIHSEETPLPCEITYR